MVIQIIGINWMHDFDTSNQNVEEETDFMVSQNAIPSKKHLGGYLPYVFTEHGVLMLANVLRSERAIKMSIRIKLSSVLF